MKGNRSKSSPRASYSPLRLARIQAGYVQGDTVSELLGIHKNTLYRYERGDTFPTVEILIKLADLYGSTLDALVGRRPGSRMGNHNLQPMRSAR